MPPENNTALNGSNHNPGQSRSIMCRGVRGAITVAHNDEQEILDATRELLQTIVRTNNIQIEDLASIYFTTTIDLDATYPAFSARQLGWFDLALLCGHEMEVEDGLERCVRVLMHWNTTKTADDIVHVYLREAQSLRPDRNNIPPVRPRHTSPIEAAVRFLTVTL